MVVEVDELVEQAFVLLMVPEVPKMSSIVISVLVSLVGMFIVVVVVHNEEKVMQPFEDD